MAALACVSVRIPQREERGCSAHVSSAERLSVSDALALWFAVYSRTGDGQMPYEIIDGVHIHRVPIQLVLSRNTNTQKTPRNPHTRADTQISTMCLFVPETMFKLDGQMALSPPDMCET
eukprot:1234887-Rhodomonas_salina.4